MARAFVLTPDILSVRGNPDGSFSITFLVVYSGSDVFGGSSDISNFQISITPTDTAIETKNKITNGVVAEGAKFGYTVAKTDIVLLDYVKGS